jgi:DNA-binding transcriptional LysR family regulator
MQVTDIKSLDLNLLKGFDALYRERSVTRAAELLCLTQPAVSGMLLRLRNNFGDPLFVRAQRGVIPTPRAIELAPQISQVLNAIDTLLRPTDVDPAEARFSLTLAATDYALHVVVTPFLAALRQQAPGISVAVLPVDDARINSRMEDGELDFALLTPESTYPDLHAQHLFEEEYVCAMRKDHPALQAGPLTLDRFCQLEHAIVSLDGGGFSGPTDAALALIGRQRKVALSVPSFLSLIRILQCSDLVAQVPRRLVSITEGLVVQAPPLTVKGFSKLLAWHERTHADPRYIWVRSLLIATCRSTN